MVRTKIKLIVLVAFFAGCAVKPIASKPQQGPPIAAKPPVAAPAVSVPEVAPTPEVVESTATPVVLPKIGLIFSGGGAKAWAHIGVLKEIEKSKWPVYAVAGFEWGAGVAAVYANNLSSNEVEWELSKVKDFEDVQQASEAIFGKKSVADLKIPFVCPSLNIAKQTIFLLNRGQLNKLMPFCLAQAPLSRPFSQSTAEMTDIASLAQHLRAAGANKIVLINVLAQENQRSFTPDYLSAENILWVSSAAQMAKKIAGVDDVVQINLDNYGLKDIEKRREIIAKGSELGYKEIKKLTAKYGL